MGFLESGIEMCTVKGDITEDYWAISVGKQKKSGKLCTGRR
jgi:hypothetical protein